MSNALLFVDDEPYYARHYVESLEKEGYEVVKEDPESGLEYLKENASSLGLIILDYMMPTPKGVSEADTLDGLATGRWFLREARKPIEELNLPVIVLTNRNVETVLQEIAEFADMKVGKLIRVRHKTETRHSYLPTIVKQLLLEPR